MHNGLRPELPDETRIDGKCFTLDVVLPPTERRNTDDPLLPAQDRFVEMTLITIGQ